MSDDLKEEDEKEKKETEKLGRYPPSSDEESKSDYEIYIQNAEKENEEQWLADMDDDTEIIDTDDAKEVTDLG